MYYLIKNMLHEFTYKQKSKSNSCAHAYDFPCKTLLDLNKNNLH